MDIQFHKLSAENFEKLSKYYGRRHDNTCDSVMLDNFLWADYYHVHFCERDDRAVLWTMKIMGKMYASLPVCAIEDMPHYFNEIERYFNENLHLPLEIYLADQEAVDYLNLPAERYSVKMCIRDRYDTYGNHKYKTTSGRDVVVYGKYGWKINQAAETDALVAAVKACQTTEREPIYESRGATHDLSLIHISRVNATRAKRDWEERSPGRPRAPMPRL